MIMERYQLAITSCNGELRKVVKAICSGFFVNAAKKDPNEGFITLVDGQSVFIHPSSSLFNRPPEFVVYHQLVLTSREYMREVLSCDVRDLLEVAPHFYRTADTGALSSRKKRERIEPLFDRYHAPNEWRLSKRRG